MAMAMKAEEEEVSEGEVVGGAEGHRVGWEEGEGEGEGEWVIGEVVEVMPRMTTGLGSTLETMLMLRN